MDDFFLIHDRYIAEGIVVPLYALFLWRLLSRHKAAIMAVDGPAFITAGVMLGLSVVVDSVQEIIALPAIPCSYNQVVEEGLKFLGGATWLYFSFEVAAHRGAGAVPGAHPDD